MLKVIAFDLFGTVLDPSKVSVKEKKEYIRQVRSVPWQPLVLPETWKNIPAFSDSVEGIEKLRKHFKVVTCSNWNKELIEIVSSKNGIAWDGIVALEQHRVYKPSLVAYAAICDLMSCLPNEILMVTGNEGSPDLIYPKHIGMNVQRIRDKNDPLTIIELANKLISV